MVLTDSDIAFILVSHLDPNHSSMLAYILDRVTRIPVIEVQDQMDVLPDHLSTIPPNREMTLIQGTIHLTIPDASPGDWMKIDLFFKSLAEEQGARAIGGIFSGTGTEGTLDTVIDGVVLTFTDNCYRKAAEEEVIHIREYAESMVNVNTVREPLIVPDQDLNVISANRSFYRTFEVSPEENGDGISPPLSCF